MQQDAPPSGMAKNEKIALTNVRLFDGQRVCEPGTIIIDGPVIGTDATDVHQIIDGRGGVLLPGLIDAHVHLLHTAHLEQLCQAGVTTALDMGCWPPDRVNSLRARVGLTDILSAGTGATSPGSRHSRLADRPKEAVVANATEAAHYVAQCVSQGSDYIKIIADVPGPDQSTLNALVTAAREHGKLSIAHAVSNAAFAMSQEAKVDMVTHIPMDKPLDDASIRNMAIEKRISIPTLTMMKSVVDSGKLPWRPDYAHARTSVRAMYRADIPILAGTDANEAAHSPASVSHGTSLHEELELLVDAGLSTVDALRAATVMPAKYFGLNDRGVIEPGRRADLLLVAGDPTKNIRETRSVQRVWCAGIEVSPGGVSDHEEVGASR